MTRVMKKLVKAKELIETKIKINSNLLDTIQNIKQEEKNIKLENEAYKMVLKLINKELRKNYRR